MYTKRLVLGLLLGSIFTVLVNGKASGEDTLEAIIAKFRSEEPAIFVSLGRPQIGANTPNMKRCVERGQQAVPLLWDAIRKHEDGKVAAMAAVCIRQIEPRGNVAELEKERKFWLGDGAKLNEASLAATEIWYYIRQTEGKVGEHKEAKRQAMTYWGASTANGKDLEAFEARIVEFKRNGVRIHYDEGRPQVYDLVILQLLKPERLAGSRVGVAVTKASHPEWESKNGTVRFTASSARIQSAVDHPESHKLFEGTLNDLTFGK